jgi:hypothetical protein
MLHEEKLILEQFCGVGGFKLLGKFSNKFLSGF